MDTRRRACTITSRQRRRSADRTDRSPAVSDSEVGTTRRYSSESYGIAVHNSFARNPTDVRHCSQHAGANVDFGDEGAVDWAFLGNLKQLRALLLS
jgi:hypothetical protein